MNRTTKRLLFLLLWIFVFGLVVLFWQMIQGPDEQQKAEAPPPPHVQATQQPGPSHALNLLAQELIEKAACAFDNEVTTV